mmetsp:Transcript_19721/g.74626  ORF Transcript_19721/g.74626 Transcript_19721/m.74626 type:complete len:225 (+) Transcript_19721:271-945(+)
MRLGRVFKRVFDLIWRAVVDRGIQAGRRRRLPHPIAAVARDASIDPTLVVVRVERRCRRLVVEELARSGRFPHVVVQRHHRLRKGVGVRWRVARVADRQGGRNDAFVVLEHKLRIGNVIGVGRLHGFHGVRGIRIEVIPAGPYPLVVPLRWRRCRSDNCDGPDFLWRLRLRLRQRRHSVADSPLLVARRLGQLLFPVSISRYRSSRQVLHSSAALVMTDVAETV